MMSIAQKQQPFTHSESSNLNKHATEWLKQHFPADSEVWLMTFKPDVDSVKVNQHAKYEYKRPFHSQVMYTHIAGCLQIQPNKFPGDTLTKLPRSHWSCFADGLYLILGDNYWAATLIPEINDPVYQVVNVTVIRNIHNHHHHLPNNWIGAKSFDWIRLLSYHFIS